MTKFPDIPRYKQKTASIAPELSGKVPGLYPFVIVGSGPVGLVLALDLARKGHQVTVLTAFDFIALGSKAICFSKQSLDILDRLGVGEQVVERGVTWSVGKLFWRNDPEPVYQFDMLPVRNQKNPGFVNIQQYYVEEHLVDALEAMDNVDIRWGNEVTAIDVFADSAKLTVDSTAGSYELEAGYVLACDGANSFIRKAMDLSFEGRVFEDNFLIADIRFTGDDALSRPSERWFWFDPPFCPGGTALLHKQPDDVWRLDFQLGWNIDRQAAILPENVEPYVRGLLGKGVEFRKEWYSVYTFQCRRMDSFVHGPMIFVGDSAHLVSPFGARGANGGLSDAENLAWKLDLVLRGKAGAALLASYDHERTRGADENILNSTRSTNFITPKNAQSMAFRDAVLELASEHDFARPFINSGRLSTPTPYDDSPLSTPDGDVWSGGTAPGHPCVDAPLFGESDQPWLLSQLGDRFTLLHFGHNPPPSGHPLAGLANSDLAVITINPAANPLAAERYDAVDGTTYLVRPDQVVAARWKQGDRVAINAALVRALGGQA
jgi:3-(3-hydroxy-phenyl)propionate hydroxylase